MTADPQDYEMSHLAELKSVENSVAIFCMAMYGEGDPTDNSQEFIDNLKMWIVDKTEDLTGVQFAVFGLGNKTFEHFNAIGRLVDQSLASLGATRLHACGEGDDDANLEEDFVSWREGLWHGIADKLGITISFVDTVGLRAFTVKTLDNADSKRVFSGEAATLKSYETQRRPFNQKNPYLAEIKANRELYGNGSERSCLHIELDIASSGMRYHAGDHVAVFATNNAELVERIGKRIDTDLDTIFTFSATDADAKKQSPFPCPCSIRTALTHYVDITSTLKQQQLRELAEYVQD
jgi:NADPH-ferrihemoprotein reductase